MASEQLGLRVLEALTARLEGRLDFHRLPRGTAVEIRFPPPERG